MVSLTPLPLYYGERASDTLWTEGWVGRSERCGEEKNLCPFQESNLGFRHQARSLVIALANLSRLLGCVEYNKIFSACLTTMTQRLKLNYMTIMSDKL
jgi:hypothetical protein